MKILHLFSAFSALAASCSALDPIVIKNNTFWVGETDERFYIRGADYQPGGSSNLTDALADSDICSRDIPYLKELGLNTIRVYSLDNTLDHDECMQKLEDAGIYVILDVNTPKASISRWKIECSYNTKYLTEVFATIDSFAKFNNTLGFFSANELVNDEDSFQYSPYIKAVTRDMKQYIKAQKYRTIPVGYSAADVSSVRYELAEYLNCGDDQDARIDMLGINDYSWCGRSSFSVSGYKEKVTDYTGYSLPIFLSEFGCNKVPGTRPFTEIGTIYSTQMSSVFSGGLVYQYFEDVNKYGLVDVDGSSVSILQDYSNLQKMYNTTSNPEGDGGAAYYEHSECPTNLNFSTAIPPQPKGLSKLIKLGPQGKNTGFKADTQQICSDDDDDTSSAGSSAVSSVISSAAKSSTSSHKTTNHSSATLSTQTTSNSHNSLTSAIKSVSSISSATKSSKNGSGSLHNPSSFMSLVALLSGALYL